MATHSSILAWKIPRTEEPGRLQSMGSQKSQTWLKRFSKQAHAVLGKLMGIMRTWCITDSLICSSVHPLLVQRTTAVCQGLSQLLRVCLPSQLFATPWTVAPLGSCVCGIFQARILEWIAISSRGSSPPRGQTHASHVSFSGRRVLSFFCLFLTTGTTWEAPTCCWGYSCQQEIWIPRKTYS